MSTMRTTVSSDELHSGVVHSRVAVSNSYLVKT